MSTLDKAAVYKTVIRPVPMNGSEICVLRKSEQNVVERTKMDDGGNMIEANRSDEIGSNAAVTNISENIK